jgi:hypothetical protein
MSRLKPKKELTDMDRLVGKVDIYKSRLGEYRYTIVFKRKGRVHGKRQALLYTGDTVNEQLYGIYNGVKEEDVRGQKISLHDAPEELIKDALDGI